MVEHNIRVISKCYDRITSTRLSFLLDLTPADTEEILSRLVVEKTVHAKVNRPEGVVVFKKQANANENLNAWAGDINALLGKMERCCHLIAREEMIAETQKQSK